MEPQIDAMQAGARASVPLPPAEHLAMAAAQGDKGAFDTIVATYQPIVRRHCQRRGLNADDAADVCQDVFLKVYRALGAYRSQNSFASWIHRVTENACIDFSRQRLRRNAVLQRIPIDEDGHEMELPGRIANPEVYVGNEYMGKRIHAALEGLSPLLRDAFTLKEMEGLRYEQIAARLGVTVGTIKSRIFRARQILTVQLADLA